MTEINLASPDFKANPYPAFSEIRTDDPIYETTLQEEHKGWLISRYEDAERALRDPRFVKNPQSAFTAEEFAKYFPSANSEDPKGRETSVLTHNMLNYDPPDHTRLRALINLSFTPRLVEHWHERIQKVADELLDAVIDKHEMDLVNDYAFPLPMIIITEMLGVPAEDRPKFRTWSNMIVESTGSREDFEKNRESFIAFRSYLTDMIKFKREHRGDDLLSQLIRSEAEGDKLSGEELISMVSLLIIAGHETTVNLISNGALALLLHPDQKEKLQQNPDLMKNAIEEFLRFQGPLMMATPRWAREDIELHGKHIKRGDMIIILLSSANRDEEIFQHANDLDITRPENHHLAFGKGIHYCLGAPLARLEGQISISTLLRRMPDLRLNARPEELTWRPGALIMGLRSFPVRF